MARPATKPDLINAANEQYKKMSVLIEAMTDDELNAEFQFGDAIDQKEAHWKRDKNLRDVLVHLVEWHNLLLCWVESNLSGVPKPFLPAPYNWKTYGQMNVAFWAKHQHTPLNKAIEMVKESHASVMEMISRLTNDELFSKGHYSWTGTTTLGSYCVSATASHYDWAMKKIKAHHKTYQKAPKT